MKMKVETKRIKDIILSAIINDNKPIKATSEFYGVPRRTVHRWLKACPEYKGRRKYDDDFKQKIIQEVLRGTSISSLSKKHNVSKGTISSWASDYKDLAPMTIEPTEFADFTDEDEQEEYVFVKQPNGGFARRLEEKSPQPEIEAPRLEATQNSNGSIVEKLSSIEDIALDLLLTVREIKKQL